MGIECGCKINKCCHENTISDNTYKCLKLDNYTPSMGANNQDLQDLIKMATKPNSDDLPMFPVEDRDGNIGPIIACTIIFATFATIGLLVYAFQYAK